MQLPLGLDHTNRKGHPMATTILRNVIGILGFQLLLLTWRLIKWGSIFVGVILAAVLLIGGLALLLQGLAAYWVYV